MLRNGKDHKVLGSPNFEASHKLGLKSPVLEDSRTTFPLLPRWPTRFSDIFDHEDITFAAYYPSVDFINFYIFNNEGFIFGDLNGDLALQKSFHKFWLDTQGSSIPLNNIYNGVPLLNIPVFGAHSINANIIIKSEGKNNNEVLRLQRALQDEQLGMSIDCIGLVRETACLSKREVTIFKLLGYGNSPECIATALDLSLFTINIYLKRIMHKMCVTSLYQAALLARFYM